MKLPVYILDVSEDLTDESAVFATGFVKQPAIESNYRTFSSHDKDKVELKFDVVSEEKQVLGGYLMVADQPIYRREEDGTQYYVVFPKASIERIIHKLAKSKKTLSFNFDHNEKDPSNSAYMFQSFMIDSELGVKAPEGFEQKPDGSWFAYVKIEDPAEWEKAKERNGFSVEGWFNDVYLLDAEEQTLENLKEKIKNNAMDLSKVEKILGKELTEKLKKAFSAETASEDPRTPLMNGGEIVGKIEVNSAVKMIDATGAEVEVPDGTHEMQDGSKITVAAGIITAMEPKENPEPEMTEEEILAQIRTAMESKDVKVVESLFNKFASSDPEIAALQTVVKILAMDAYGWQIREKEREAQVEQVTSAIATFSKQNPLQKEVDELKATNKLLFEAITVLGEIKQELPPAKDPKNKTGNERAAKFEKLHGVLSKINTSNK